MTTCDVCWFEYDEASKAYWCPHNDVLTGTVTLNRRNAIGQWVEKELPFDFTAEQLDGLVTE